MNTYRIIPALLLAFAANSALALTETEPLSMVYEEPEAKAPSGPHQNAIPTAAGPLRVPGCSLRLGKLEDARRNKETVGAGVFMVEALPGAVPLFTASLLSGDGLKWLDGAIRTLPRSGIAVREGEAGGADVALKLAHAWNGGMNLLSHVVLETSTRAGDAKDVKRYHGFGIKLNWAGGNGEYMTALNIAMADALRAYVDDLQRGCAGGRQAAS
jgi:hypothetical protein